MRKLIAIVLLAVAGLAMPAGNRAEAGLKCDMKIYLHNQTNFRITVKEIGYKNHKSSWAMAHMWPSDPKVMPQSQREDPDFIVSLDNYWGDCKATKRRVKIHTQCQGHDHLHKFETYLFRGRGTGMTITFTYNGCDEDPEVAIDK